VKVGVLGLQGDVREHLRVLEEIGVTGVIVRRAEELDDVDGLVLPGGESTTIGKLLDRFGILEPLRDRARAGFPLLGTCAGLILMAREVKGAEGTVHLLGVLDAKVQRNAYGRQVESFEADIPYGDGVLRGAFIRAPIVEEVGPGVHVLAHHEDRPVLLRQGNLVAASFHPEIVGEDTVHRLFLRTISER
jgi:5'-phosphate synthase pdxT subunit